MEDERVPGDAREELGGEQLLDGERVELGSDRGVAGDIGLALDERAQAPGDDALERGALGAERRDIGVTLGAQRPPQRRLVGKGGAHPHRPSGGGWQEGVGGTAMAVCSKIL